MGSRGKNIIAIITSAELCFFTTLLAQDTHQDIPVTSSGDIRFYVDYTAFHGYNGSTDMEFYLMIYADQMEYREEQDRNKAEFQIQTVIENNEGDQISSDSRSTTAYLATENDEPKYQVIYDQWHSSLAPGEYDYYVTVTDLYSSHNGLVMFKVQVPEIIQSSQIQFVSAFESGSETHPFFKSNRLVYPCPSRRYGIMNSVLYFYYELYSLQSEEYDSLHIYYSIKDQEEDNAKSFPRKSIPVKNSDISVSHGLNVFDLKSGIYDLIADIEPGDGSEKFQISRRFEVIQKDYFDQSPLLTDEQFAVHDGLLKYLATPAQYKQYSVLSTDTKTQFLVRFWREQDPVADTPENEYLMDVMERYNYANEKFSWGKYEGWKSERGQILIKYGYPDELNRYEYEENLNPYEIWQYFKNRNYIFVFGDLWGSGRYILLHSNAEREAHDYEWQKRLIKTF